MPTRADADRLARLLVEGRLAGCVHVNETASTYRWTGEVRQEAEFVVEARTTLRNQRQVVLRMEQDHPYDTPLVESWPVDMVPQRYAAWLAGEVH